MLAIALGADLDPGLLRAVPDEIERMLAAPDGTAPIVDEMSSASPGGNTPAARPASASPGATPRNPPGWPAGREHACGAPRLC